MSEREREGERATICHYESIHFPGNIPKPVHISGCCKSTKFGKSRVDAVTILELHVHTTGWVEELQLWYNTWIHHLSCGKMEISIASDCWATVRVTEKVKYLGMGLIDTHDVSEDFVITFSGLTSTSPLASPLICLCYHMIHFWFNTNTLLSHSHTGLYTYKIKYPQRPLNCHIK